jgi:hypothetical protein
MSPHGQLTAEIEGSKEERLRQEIAGGKEWTLLITIFFGLYR